MKLEGEIGQVPNFRQQITFPRNSDAYNFFHIVMHINCNAYKFLNIFLYRNYLNLVLKNKIVKLFGI